MEESYSELIPAMDINEIILYFVNPNNFKEEIGSEELEKAKKVLEERFDINYKAAESLRETIANFKCKIEYFKSRKINNQLDHLKWLLRARPNFIIKVQKKHYLQYWDLEDKKHTPEIPYLKIKDLELKKWVDLSLLTDAYHQYFDLGIKQKRGKHIPDFNTTIATQKAPKKNEFLVHKKTESSKAYFYTFFIRQKDKESIIRKIYKNIIVEEYLAKLEKRLFNEEDCYTYDYVGLEVNGGYILDRNKQLYVIDKSVLEPLFFPPGEPIGYWQHDGKKHAKSRLDCIKYYLINSNFPFSTVALRYTDIISVISEGFTKEITDLIKYSKKKNSNLDDKVLTHPKYKREWYKVDEEKKEKIKKNGGTICDINELEKMIKEKEKYFNQINERLSIILP